LKDSASSFPPEFASYKVLPSLLSALEFGGASAATILPLVLRFGENTSPDEYSKLILSPIIKLFASPDRGTRVALLEHLPEYVEKLDKKAVNEKIFPHFVSQVCLVLFLSLKKITATRLRRYCFPYQRSYGQVCDTICSKGLLSI
jgi:hypothetical protein